MSDYWGFLSRHNPFGHSKLVDFGQQLWDSPYFMTNLPVIGDFYRSPAESKRQQDIIRNANGRSPAYPELFYQNVSAQAAWGSVAGNAINSVLGTAKAMARDIVDMYPADVMESVDWHIQRTNFRRGYNVQSRAKPYYPKYKLR